MTNTSANADAAGAIDMEAAREKARRNARIQTRYDELVGAGRGHYETIFRIVREEVERDRTERPTNPSPEIVEAALCVDEPAITSDEAIAKIIAETLGHDWIYVPTEREEFHPVDTKADFLECAAAVRAALLPGGLCGDK